jgi:hypothetical protein
VQYVVGIAAVVLLVVGVGISLASMDGNDSNDSNDSAAGGSGTETSAGADVQDSEGAGDAAPSESATTGSVPEVAFGDVAGATALRDEVTGLLSAADATTSAQPPATLDRDGTTDHDTAAPARATDECATSRAVALGVSMPPVLRGPIVYDGAASEVLVFASAGGHVIVVVDPGSCALVTSQFLAR